MRILIVDDSEDTRHLIGSFLQSAGHDDILAAGSASEALQLLNSDTGTDLILMDIMMPETDGIEFCRRLKSDRELQAIPIIMVTASDEAESLERAFEAGATDYVTKPVDRTELIARVRAALRLKTEMDMRRSREAELAKSNDELTLALAQINFLCGLIPICSNCKKVRDDRGRWDEVEVYISKHSKAQFTHCICADCMRQLYPD